MTGTGVGMEVVLIRGTDAQPHLTVWEKWVQRKEKGESTWVRGGKKEKLENIRKSGRRSLWSQGLGLGS